MAKLMKLGSSTYEWIIGVFQLGVQIGFGLFHIRVDYWVKERLAKGSSTYSGLLANSIWQSPFSKGSSTCLWIIGGDCGGIDLFAAVVSTLSGLLGCSLEKLHYQKGVSTHEWIIEQRIDIDQLEKMCFHMSGLLGIVPFGFALVMSVSTHVVDYWA